MERAFGAFGFAVEETHCKLVERIALMKGTGFSPYIRTAK
jgi:hypothetical protein